MENPKDMILADAIKQAIEGSRRIIKLKRLILLLSISNAVFIIALLVVIICD